MDRQITELSTGKRHCPLVREPLVVDDCCRDKRLNDRVAIGLAHPRRASRSLRPARVWSDARGMRTAAIERFLTSQRSIQLPGTLSAELDADREPGRRHCIEGQGPPAGPIEIDLDAATSSRAGGLVTDRRRHSLAPALIVAYASTSTSTSTSTSSTAGDASSPERSSPT